MVTRSPLGRGLASLLPTSAHTSGFQDLPTGAVQPDPDQPRKTFDEEALQQLAHSITRHGMIQPLIVRKAHDRYILVAGERRWRAARIAGLHRVPVVLREPTGSSPFELALVENLQRQDLNPVDEALAYQHLRDCQDKSAGQIASLGGKSRSHVANMIRLLDLPDIALTALGVGSITPGHGRAILTVSSKQDRPAFFARLVEGRWSVRRAEREARMITEQKERPAPKKNPLCPYYAQMEHTVGAALGAKAHIRARTNHGVLEIPFASLEELKEITEKIIRGLGTG